MHKRIETITVHSEYRSTVPIHVLDRDHFSTEHEFRDSINDILDKYRKVLDNAKRYQLGYPIYHVSEHEKEIDFSPLEKIKNYYINNVGSPDVSTSFASNSHSFEMGVLHWFAGLWEIDRDMFWGYVTNGGTESNIQAMYLGRETFPDAVAYVSRDAHFSVFKACHLLRIEVELVGTDDTGEMVYDHLKECLQRNRGKPAIVILTCGTTMTGAIDQPEKAIDALHQAGYRKEEDYFVHVDAALSGIFMPLLEDQGAPKVSFQVAGVCSISCSGHKFLGAPISCGVMMVRRTYVERIGNTIEYISSKDLTLTCSRNGHASMYLWLMLTELGKKRIKQDALRCIKRAQTVQQRISAGGYECWVNPFSITVVIEKPEDPEFVNTWQLACQGSICHIVVMPHIRDETLNTFVESYLSQKPRDVERSDLENMKVQQRESCYYNGISFLEENGSKRTL